MEPNLEEIFNEYRTCDLFAPFHPFSLALPLSYIGTSTLGANVIKLFTAESYAFS